MVDTQLQHNILLHENVSQKLKDRLLRYLDGPQKLKLRQVNRSLVQVIDNHRESQ